MTLTQEEIDKLYITIHNDQNMVDAALAGNDQEVCRLINIKSIIVHRKVPYTMLLRWAAVRGVMSKLQSAAINESDEIKSIAQAALAMFRSGVDLILDTETLSLIQLLIPSVLTQDDLDDLLTRCAEKISLAEQEVNKSLSIEDIGIILSKDRPDGKIPKA